jgi:hypothetical protein
MLFPPPNHTKYQITNLNPISTILGLSAALKAHR